MAGTLPLSEFILYGITALAAALVGMLTPKLNNLLFSDVLVSGSSQVLLAIAVFLVCASISGILLKAVQALLMARIDTRLEISVQAAAMMRILSLPADFFKKYSSGDLASRMQYMEFICEQVVSGILSVGLTAVFSLVYITQIFAYAPALALPAMLLILLTFLFFCGYFCYPDAEYKKEYGGGGRRKRHQLCADLRRSEDPAVRFGKNGLLPAGEIFCKGGRLYV